MAVCGCNGLQSGTELHVVNVGANSAGSGNTANNWCWMISRSRVNWWHTASHPQHAHRRTAVPHALLGCGGADSSAIIWQKCVPWTLCSHHLFGTYQFLITPPATQRPARKKKKGSASRSTICPLLRRPSQCTTHVPPSTRRPTTKSLPKQETMSKTLTTFSEAV